MVRNPMSASMEDRSKAATKLKKLAKLAEALRQGEHFQITRLTILKGFCQDPTAAAKFGLHLAKLAGPKAKKRYRPLIDRAMVQIERHLRRRSANASEAAWSALHDLKESQNEMERHRWADVRIIHCREALLAEYALRVIIRPRESAYWGYRLAAWYAERYDPRHGTGLIPASATAVEEIAAFWAKHYSIKCASRA
jgi:hypothetical protein